MSSPMERVERSVVAGIHAKVEAEADGAFYRSAAWCRTSVKDIAKAEGVELTEEEYFRLMKICDDEARKWMKMQVEEWAK
jgi:hypothetical protein